MFPWLQHPRALKERLICPVAGREIRDQLARLQRFCAPDKDNLAPRGKIAYVGNLMLRGSV